MDIVTPTVDRQTTTPFHLKLFYKAGGFHRPEEFTSTTDLPEHVQVYTWQTCSLRELSHLLISALPSLLPTPYIGTRLSYRLTFPDTRATSSGPGRFMTKELGSIIIGDGGPGILPDDEESAIVAGGLMAGALVGEPEKTLQDAKFVIGDYVCCAVIPPLENGGVPPPIVGGPTRGGFGFGGGRAGGDFGRGGRDGGFGGGGGGFRGGRGGMRGGSSFGQSNVPTGEWRRGERVPDGPSGGGGGRGRGYGGGGYGGRGRGW